eukprot:TRINITY_DN403_c4_g1_i4.p1 TRINITY_DN403_c4_g1~~TRINITY_DN403_c4_g1_i4.p1  ORF type:complete len:118 (+),score=5.16 TRINITY_DN403_c4_g1_i4:29-355(+)
MERQSINKKQKGINKLEYKRVIQSNQNQNIIIIICGVLDVEDGLHCKQKKYRFCSKRFQSYRQLQGVFLLSLQKQFNSAQIYKTKYMDLQNADCKLGKFMITICTKVF